MTPVAIVLLLVAAVLHASWNTVAKRAALAGGGGPVFVWLFTACSSVIYFPVALYILLSSPQQAGHAQVAALTGWTAAAVVMGGLLHLSYYITLQKGYSVGDLSIVYPVARGTAPLIATAGAIFLFAERPSVIAIAGGVLVSFSVFLLSGGPGPKQGGRSPRLAVKYGLVIAMFIASYTLWDKHVLNTWRLSPVLLDWGTNFTLGIMMLPYVIPRWERVKSEWKLNGKKAIAIGVLCPLTYILVLQVLSFTPASYVAPAREVSILVGAIIGARILHEGGARRRIAGAVGMVVALTALALG